MKKILSYWIYGASLGEQIFIFKNTWRRREGKKLSEIIVENFPSVERDRDIKIQENSI